MKKEILIGIGILTLLILAGSTDAKMFYAKPPYPDCAYCHTGDGSSLNNKGIYFNVTHKFNGSNVPLTTKSCFICHNDTQTFFPLTSTGTNYSKNHRYNETTLAATKLKSPACANCHVNAEDSNFSLLKGTPSYLKSETCQNCHKQKYDDWKGTMHSVMLTKNTTAQEMNLPLPPGFGWENISYMIVGKGVMRYINETGYRFKEYNVTSKTFSNYSGAAYTCGGCHTTGFNSSGNQDGLPGLRGTWSEPGIACERCHKAGGGGHQVEVNVSAKLCLECHSGGSRKNTEAYQNSVHAPPLQASASNCATVCHSPFDYAKGKTITSTTAVNIVCANCHNLHNTSDDLYREMFSPNGFNASKMADVKEPKLSFFNSTASRQKGYDVYDTLKTPTVITFGVDSSYKDRTINVTGPLSEVLCSQCHYNHGLSHIGEVNLSHARKNYPKFGLKPATCIDCHMATSVKDHSFDVKAEANFPSLTCSRGTQCHVTSDQDLSHSNYSVVPIVNEWEASAHNNSKFAIRNNSSRCAKCHSPINWNPANSTTTTPAENYKGVTCSICHNMHDMGNWLINTEAKYGKEKPFAFYDRDGIQRSATSFRANYTMLETTTELCINCHTNREDYLTPGWGSRGPHGAVVPHPSSQADMFIGSWKDASIMKFECSDCHMYSTITDANGNILPDNEKVKGHTFKVNANGLTNSTQCNGCHSTNSRIGSVSKTIETIKTEIMAKWNTTNQTVESAWSAYDAYNGEKNLSKKKLAEAFFKLYEVRNDGSWGSHNPLKANELLDAASRLADESNKSLGQKDIIVSKVLLKTGWNLVALSGKPSVTSSESVMNSVKSNITVVWGYNSTTYKWELYDPAMPSQLNTLKEVVQGKGYWISAKDNVEWTV